MKSAPVAMMAKCISYLAKEVGHGRVIGPPESVQSSHFEGDPQEQSTWEVIDLSHPLGS
jgi:hypothetical protein